MKPKVTIGRALINVLNNLLHYFRTKSLNPNSLFCKLLRNIGVGRFVFRARVMLYKSENLLGYYNQRFLEYPWILGQLRSGQGRLLLDVGCTGSLLDHELLARGFRVVGLDINDNTMRNNREVFVQVNVLKTGLPSEIFDVILVVSTVEHIGLDAYGQDLLNDNADFLAMQELRRLLKPHGILLLTLPYEGKGPTRIHRFGNRGEFLERRYDCERLSKLLEHFTIVNSTFYLCMLKHHCKFVPIEKDVLDQFSFKICESSLSCLILKKEA